MDRIPRPSISTANTSDSERRDDFDGESIPSDDSGFYPKPDVAVDLNFTIEMTPQVVQEPTFFDDQDNSNRFESTLCDFIADWDTTDHADFDMFYEAANNAIEKGIEAWFDGDDLDAAVLDLFGGQKDLKSDRTKPRFRYDDQNVYTPTMPRDTSSFNIRARDLLTGKDTDAMWPAEPKGRIYMVFRPGRGPIYLVDEDDNNIGIVGIPNEDGRRQKAFKLEVAYNEGYTRACIINEESPVKGTALAFSNLVHFSAICAIACKQNVRNTIIEPIEGHDLTIDGITFEVTGMNYRKRKTNADFVINKYALFRYSHPPLDLYRRLIDWSIKEDRKDTSFLKGTSYDVGRSPYTDYVDRLHEKTPLVTYQIKRMLVMHFQRYVSELPTEGPFIFNRPKVDFDRLRADLNLSMKKTGYPTPFFALPIRADREISLDGLRLNMVPFKFVPPSGPTAFRTKIVTNCYDTLLMANEERQGGPATNYETLMSGIFRFLYNFRIFQAIYLESELFPKIVGKQGCFFSVYTGVGICWSQVNHNSLVYNVSFYQTWEPDSEELVGIWAKAEYDGMTVYQSSTLKINRGEILYAQMLPYRVVTKVVAALPYCQEGQKLDIVKRILQIATVQRHSTWQTSKICGDFRFITLCSLAGSGDPAGLCAKGMRVGLDRHLSFPNYYLIQKMMLFASRWDGEPTNHTPVFGLPVRFLALEKDLPLGLYWHLRSESHHTNCVKKMLDSVKDEIDTRNESLSFYSRQCDLMDKLVDEGGLSYSDFKTFMDSVPEYPVYNHILFTAMSYLASSDLKELAGARQWPTDLALNNLITDHKMAEATFTGGKFENCVIKDGTVATGLVKHLSKYGTVLSIHDLILKQSFDEPQPNVYTLHAKDAKSSDREISQMLPHMRPIQFYSECMNSIYSDSENTDLMSDPKKYCKVVKMFQPLLRKGAFSRSEDKSFFCGHMHPEFMSLATLSIGIDTGSTALVSSAAFQRMDSHRYVVMPTQAKLEEIRQDIPWKPCVRMDRKKPVVTRGFCVFKHMQQGIRAFGGAVIHTTFIKGFSRMLSGMIPEIECYAQATTSDDSTRVVRINQDCVFDKASVANEFLNKPVKFLNHCMMKDSIDKAQVNSRLCEFNNLVVGPSGAIPQLFAHADLVIQPLYSHNIARDILDSTSMARSSIVWGDSPDLACAAMWSYDSVLRQKWLLTEQEMDFLKHKGFFPASFEELVSGGCHMTPETVGQLWSLLSEESKELCRSGKYDVLHVLSQFNFKDEIGDKNNRKKVKKEKVPEGLGFNMKMKIEQINASRIFRGKLSGKYITQKPPALRRSVTNNLLDALSVTPPRLDQDIHDQVNRIRKPPVLVALCKPKVWHLAPQQQGGSTTLRDRIDLRQVLMCRFGKMAATNHPNLFEEQAASLPDDEFETWFRTKLVERNKIGTSFQSVFGYPLTTQRYDNKATNPRAFVLTGEPVPIPRDVSGLTIGGVLYPDLTICIVGETTLNNCRRTKALPAFAYTKMGDRRYFFFKPEGKDIMVGRMRMPRDDEKFMAVSHAGFRVYIQLTPDDNPLDLPKYFNASELQGSSSYLSGVLGSPTALLQYGMYIHSDHNLATRLLNKVFRTVGAERPPYLIRLYPQYPTFLANCTVIEKKPTVELIGFKSILKLRLKMPENSGGPYDYMAIDLTGDIPKVVESNDKDLVVEDEIEFEAFEEDETDRLRRWAGLKKSG